MVCPAHVAVVVAFDMSDNLDAVLKLKIRNAGFVVSQLRDYRDAAFLARKLTAIACDAPLTCELDGLTRRDPDLEALDRLYDSFGFGRLLRNQAERILAKDRARKQKLASPLA